MPSLLPVQSSTFKPNPPIFISPSFSLQNPLPIPKLPPLPLKISPTQLQIHTNHHSTTQKPAPFLENHQRIKVGRSPILQMPFHFISLASLALPCLAAETDAVASEKIDIEAIVIGIDDFFNRYPFFVAGVTFIWLVVIPLTQEYLKKCKPISAIDAFRKLRDVESCQLLDIRKKQSLRYLGSPNLKLINKSVVQVEFVEGQEDGFVREVIKSFKDPGNTVICVLDNFDGDSLKVAELLHKNGFKEAYAIKGGIRGKDGWQAIQETLLPPSMHVYPRKKIKPSDAIENDGEKLTDNDNVNGQPHSSLNAEDELSAKSQNLHGNSSEMSVEAKVSHERPLSPYPNYEDLKPPSSPTPSKPH